jgi:hypothetical protein
LWVTGIAEKRALMGLTFAGQYFAAACAWVITGLLRRRVKVGFGIKALIGRG